MHTAMAQKNFPETPNQHKSNNITWLIMYTYTQIVKSLQTISNLFWEDANMTNKSKYMLHSISQMKFTHTTFITYPNISI